MGASNNSRHLLSQEDKLKGSKFCKAGTQQLRSKTKSHEGHVYIMSNLFITTRNLLSSQLKNSWPQLRMSNWNKSYDVAQKLVNTAHIHQLQSWPKACSRCLSNTRYINDFSKLNRSI